MTDPTTTHLVPTRDGRTLAVDVTGPDDGPVVLFLHSAPGSRRFDPDPATTAAAGIRLVTFDRAGYGGSTPFAADHVPTVAGQAADAATVLDALDAGSAAVAVAGWSAGGRIGAALAAARPDLIRALAIVATPAPDAAVPWVSDEQRALAEAWRAEPELATTRLGAALGQLPVALADDAVARSQVSAGAADDALLDARPDLADALTTMVRAAVEHGTSGLAADIVADQVAPWGFDTAGISAPTRCWYGAADEVVTTAHGTWWADRIAGAELTVVDGAGHLVVATAWADVLAHLTAPR